MGIANQTLGKRGEFGCSIAEMAAKLSDMKQWLDSHAFPLSDKSI